MGKLLGQLTILIVDDDDLLKSEADALGHPAIAFSALAPKQVSASKGSLSDRDIVVVGVDTPGGLEHTLLLAELRGAALSLPKPIDGVELALAAIELIRARSGSGAMAHVAKDLERRLDW